MMLAFMGNIDIMSVVGDEAAFPIYVPRRYLICKILINKSNKRKGERTMKKKLLLLVCSLLLSLVFASTASAISDGKRVIFDTGYDNAVLMDTVGDTVDVDITKLPVRVVKVSNEYYFPVRFMLEKFMGLKDVSDNSSYSIHNIKSDSFIVKDDGYTVSFHFLNIKGKSVKVVVSPNNIKAVEIDNMKIAKYVVKTDTGAAMLPMSFWKDNFELNIMTKDADAKTGFCLAGSGDLGNINFNKNWRISSVPADLISKKYQFTEEKAVKYQTVAPSRFDVMIDDLLEVYNLQPTAAVFPELTKLEKNIHLTTSDKDGDVVQLAKKREQVSTYLTQMGPNIANMTVDSIVNYKKDGNNYLVGVTIARMAGSPNAGDTRRFLVLNKTSADKFIISAILLNAVDKPKWSASTQFVIDQDIRSSMETANLIKKYYVLFLKPVQ